MTKSEAITAMKNGLKVTHRYFSSDEWMTMQDGRILLEDGCKCSPEEFWRWRKDNNWNDGYSLFKT